VRVKKQGCEIRVKREGEGWVEYEMVEEEEEKV